MIGRVLDGYRVLAPLGRGGMGEVWRAEDTNQGGRPVALKLLARDREESASAIERLRREGGLLAKLAHRGIAAIYGVGECEGLHYIAMELIEGETLSARIARGPLDPEEVRHLGREAGEALALAHSRGVLHRDITSNNLMLAPHGRVVLLDFGLALVEGRSRLTSTGAIVGTPQFLAPEVIRNHDPDARSDLYSLGIALYEAITGTLPFGEGRAEQAYWAALHDKAEPPSRRRNGLAREWDDVVMRAMAREPGLRFQSAEELVRALESLAEVRSDQATNPMGGATGIGPGRVTRIAVLPFTDMSASPAGAALAHGLAEALGAALSRYPGLQIVPAVTTRELAGEGVRRVAREFDADHVVSGTLLRTDDRMRVTCSLVDGRKASQLLAETLEGALRELPDIENQLVNAIAAELRLAVSPKRRPDSEGADVESGEQFLKAKSYLQRPDNEASVDGAIKLLEKLAQRPEATAECWAELVRAFRQKHHLTNDRVWLERAIHASERALAVDPESALAVYEKARVDVLLGRLEEAEDGFRRASESRPDLARPHTGMAELLRTRGDLHEAELECRRAIALNPADWGPFNLLGAVLFQRGRYAESIEAWQTFARLSPDNPRAFSNMGSAHFQLGQLEEAEQQFRISLEFQPTGAAIAGLGSVLFRRRDFTGAALAFERGVTLSPNDAIMWGNLGSALRWQETESDRARRSFERAVRIARDQLGVNPRQADLMADLAVWLSCLGELEEAQHWIARALDLDPADGHNLRHAVAVHERCGHRAEALQFLERAIPSGQSWDEIEFDAELASLRNSPEYGKLRARLEPAGSSDASSKGAGPRPEVES